MKRLSSLKLVDFVGERDRISAIHDGDKISAEEQGSVSKEQTSISEEQACASTSEEQACANMSEEQACANMSEEQACANMSEEQACASRSEEQGCASRSEEQACANMSEEALANMSDDEFLDYLFKEPDWYDMSKEQDFAYTVEEPKLANIFKEPVGSTLEEQAVVFAKHPDVLRLKRLHSEFPRLSLPAYVDFGNLLSIAQKYIEFRPIIRIVLLLNTSLAFLGKSEQKKVVAAVVKIEEYINEIVEFADKPYDPKEVDELFCHLGCRLDYICGILQKTRVLSYSCFLVFGFDVYPSENRRLLVMREKIQEVDESFMQQIGKTRTFLRTRLDTKYLTEISRDHPEFGPSINTVLNVYAAMKYLNYEGQVEVFKPLYNFQEALKQLVIFKKYLNVYCFEKYIPNLISKALVCSSELLEVLRNYIVPPRTQSSSSESEFEFTRESSDEENFLPDAKSSESEVLRLKTESSSSDDETVFGLVCPQVAMDKKLLIPASPNPQVADGKSDMSKVPSSSVTSTSQDSNLGVKKKRERSPLRIPNTSRVSIRQHVVVPREGAIGFSCGGIGMPDVEFVGHKKETAPPKSTDIKPETFWKGTGAIPKHLKRESTKTPPKALPPFRKQTSRKSKVKTELLPEYEKKSEDLSTETTVTSKQTEKCKGSSEINLNCNICGKESKNNKAFRKHSLIHNDKPHVCEICQKRFSEKSNMVKHFSTHSSYRTYECEKCKKEFRKKDDFNRHLLTHSGVKPHPCHVCTKTFARSSNLRQHLLIHTGEKAYGCEVCRKTFTQKSHLKVHARTHSQ